ncbi:hypothetical protein [Hymenobacter norwichensis]|uniref:hypothetical protein n=1 Tax=Hymenobacter norwichensis TaxID=223903 RepID=UPI0003B37FCC|nr:hypothetical protein [Hymenobacter norwichensis]
MTTDEWLNRYYALNQSFSKRLIFRLGVDSGFFSEYNNMLLALLYCLKHGIRFELYSDHTHFALRDGWNDFFVPFGAANTQRINKDYNLRPYIIEQSKEAPLQKLVKYCYITAAYKLLFGVDYLTQDLWAHHRNPSFAHTTFTIPELGFEQTPLLEATQWFIKALWNYNQPSGQAIAQLTQTVVLPAEYISLHIRAGDKFTETKMYDFSEYMVPATRFSANQTAFVMTDDYTVVEQLRKQYTDWQFHTLCLPSERGYFHKAFVKQDRQAKYQHHLQLFAAIDITAGATKFIGTYNSNPGMYMGMRIGPERCFCLDSDEWVLIQL